MAPPYSSLEWRQTSPGVWQRAVDEIEEFYSTMVVLYKASGRMFFGMTGFLSLSIPIDSGSNRAAAEASLEESLKKAWLTLRFNHPTLGSQVTETPETREWTKTYQQFHNDDDKDKWLKNSFVPVSCGQTGTEWANSDPPAPDMPTLFVITPPDDPEHASVARRDLVFRSPHDIIDGIGTLIMLNNLITEAANAYKQGTTYQTPIFDGSEVANLSPSYRIAAKVPHELTDKQKARMKSISDSKAAVQSGDVDILALPYRKGAVVPGRHQRIGLTFSKEETQSLLAACKKINVTPTHAFHAAAAMVDRDIQPPPKETKKVRYINYILRNERQACDEPYNSALHPAAVYHSVSGQSLVVDMNLQRDGERADEASRRLEFISIVAHMSSFYSEVRNDAEHAQLAPDLWALGIPPLPSTPRPLPVPGPNPHPSVSISSMGRVDDIVKPQNGPFRVHDAWVTGEELGNGLGLFLGTFDGRLCLSAAYNDAWHTREDATDFLERSKAVVFEGLRLTQA